MLFCHICAIITNNTPSATLVHLSQQQHCSGCSIGKLLRRSYEGMHDRSFFKNAEMQSWKKLA